MYHVMGRLCNGPSILRPAFLYILHTHSIRGVVLTSHAVLRVCASAYDGLCYNARRVEELLDTVVDRIHFDEAWYDHDFTLM